jgi:flagellin
MTGPVNTNLSAFFALQNLNKTNRDLDIAQGRISTGLKIAKAKDNGAVFNVANQLRTDRSASEALQAGLSRALSTADIAMAAGQRISDLLVQMRDKALSATAINIPATTRGVLNDEFQSLLAEINQFVNNAAFDGNNLLDGNGDPSIPALSNVYDVLANTTGTQVIEMPVTDFRLLTSLTPAPPAPVPPATALPYPSNQMQLEQTSDILTPDSAADIMLRISATQDFVNSQLGRIGVTAKRIESHTSFIAALQDSTSAGIGALVDTDYGLESARLQAAQVKQQLTTQSLSIANAAPQAILALLRG